MDIKRILTGDAPDEESRKFWRVAMAAGFALMALSVVEVNYLAAYFGYEIGIPYVVVVAGMALALSAALIKPTPPKAVEVLLLVAVAITFLNFVRGDISFGGSGFTVPAVGFLVMTISALPALKMVFENVSTDSTAQFAPPVTTSGAAVASRSAGNRDAVLYTAIAGAAAVGLSLLALPWFALESFDWNDSVNITFNNLRDVYNYARDNGFDGDVRFFYLEWGYIVSYATAIFAAVSALRLRDGKSTVSIPLLNVAIGATCLVGLWQGAIATALTQLDDDGSVQFGVWLGVIGHVAIVVSFVMMRQMMNRPRVSLPGSNLPY